LLELYHKYTYKAWSEIAFYNGCMMVLLNFDKSYIMSINLCNCCKFIVFCHLFNNSLYIRWHENRQQRGYLKSSKSWHNLFYYYKHTHWQKYFTLFCIVYRSWMFITLKKKHKKLCLATFNVPKKFYHWTVILKVISWHKSLQKISQN